VKILYDGGSDLHSVDVKKTAKGGELYDFYLFFSDGLSSLHCKSYPDVLEAPVYVFSSSKISDPSVLKKWGLFLYLILFSSTFSDKERRKISRSTKDIKL